MKKLLIFLSLILAGAVTFGQAGIDSIIVEKVENSVATGTHTYRVFVDMEPNYGFSAVYGELNNYLKVTTSSQWWNASAGASIYGENIDPLFFPSFPTLRYDSWVTANAGAKGKIGVPLSKDPDGYIDETATDTIVPITAVGLSIPFWNQDVQSGNLNTNNGSWAGLVTGGVKGPDADNQVMIGQFTTDGEFSFELNLQLIDSVGGQVKVTARDASGTTVVNPGLVFSTVETNLPPAVEITDPVDGTDLYEDSLYTFTVAADDPNTIDSLQLDYVEYRVNGGTAVNIGTASSFQVNIPAGEEGNTWTVEVQAWDKQGESSGWQLNSYPIIRLVIPPSVTLDSDVDEVVEGGTITFDATILPGTRPVNNIEWYVYDELQSETTATFAWLSDTVGPAVPVKVVVTTDDGSDEATKNVKVISGDASYQFLDIEELCSQSNTFCMVLEKIVPSDTLIIGYDIDITYDSMKVVPTGMVTVYQYAGGAGESNTEYYTNINTPGRMHLSIALEGNAGDGIGWDNDALGSLICVEFAKLSGFQPTDTAVIGAENIIESYPDDISDLKVAATGSYITWVDNNFYGTVKFWADNSGLYSAPVAINTTIRTQNGDVEYTDPAGNFKYNPWSGDNDNIRIEKDVNNASAGPNHMTAFNGYDSYLTALLLVNHPSVLASPPSAEQVIAMDVNLDGHVSAGDVSQMNQRATVQRDVFFQQGGSGKDWSVINEEDYARPTYDISSTFPGDDGSGYSKMRVPFVPAYWNLLNWFNDDPDCPVIINDNNTWYGILLGDVDGSYKDATADGLLKSAGNAMVHFDLSGAVYEEDYVSIPVRYHGDEILKSLDFIIEYERSSLILQSVISHDRNVEFVFNEDERYLYLLSYSLNGYNVDEPLFSVRFYAPDRLKSEDLISTWAFVNGKKAETSLSSTTFVEEIQMSYSVYPNPASERLYFEVAEEVQLQLFDVHGRMVFNRANVTNLESIDVSGFENGIYLLKITSDDSFEVKRIVIEK